MHEELVDYAVHDVCDLKKKMLGLGDMMMCLCRQILQSLDIFN